MQELFKVVHYFHYYPLYYFKSVASNEVSQLFSQVFLYLLSLLELDLAYMFVTVFLSRSTGRPSLMRSITAYFNRAIYTKRVTVTASA